MNTSWLGWVLVLVSAAWLWYDADQLKLPLDGRRPYSSFNGAVGWAICTVLMWIVTVPYYLYRRSRRGIEPPPQPTTPQPLWRRVLGLLGGVLLFFIALGLVIWIGMLRQPN